MQAIWMVVFLFVGLAFAQDYEDYFDLFDEKDGTTSSTTTKTTITGRPTTQTTTDSTTGTTGTTGTTTMSTSTTTFPTTMTTEKMVQLLSSTPISFSSTTPPNGEITTERNGRLESIFFKAFKTINLKMDKLMEGFSKISSETTTTTTTTTTNTPTTPPPKITKFLEEDVFDVDFFESNVEEKEEYGEISQFINGNLKVVVGVCLLVGSVCFVIPICIALFWCLSKKFRKEKSDEMEMPETVKTETEKTKTNDDEESPVYNDVSNDRPLPPTPPKELR